MKEQNHPNVIKIRNAHVHNLKHINVDIPLNKIVGIAGVSGSGKSSLALGVLYAEGSRRYLDALSTYTRRRMTQAPRAQVDEVLHIPAALALHQRPGVPGIRSTFGTGSELLNTLRLMFSRLANHCCPNGHYLEPTLDVAAGKELCCPVCGTHFWAPSAEELSFNSQGACQTCGGTGFVRKVDEASLVPDESLSIDEGAVLPWKTLMWSLMTDVCREMGVRTDVPFQELTKEEKEIVYHGPAEKKHIFYKAKNTNQSGELDFTYFNAVYTVENALSKVKDEKGMKRVERFLKEDICPDCGGTRLSKRARQPKLCGITRAVRNRTTGVLYVLDEPSIGLHPSNIVGLTDVMHDLIADGNSVILVDHDTQILSEADWLVEMGPKAGADGGRIIAQGTIPEIEENPDSQIGTFLKKTHPIYRKKASEQEMFSLGTIHLSTDAIHTVKPLEADIPKGRLTVVTGVSGSGKTTLILESLIPALESMINGTKLPSHVKNITAEDVEQVKLIDAAPIGINVRSTVATYANVHDELRKVYAKLPDAKEAGYKAGDFSYNTGKLRCPTCDGTGSISLDVQFLPDVEVPCPDCHGSRYNRGAGNIKRKTKSGELYSLPELMDMDVQQALHVCEDMKKISSRLQILKDLGLGYLTLGEATPSLSGGEAQRLKLASEMERKQDASVFVFDEPTIGLHPLDVQTLLQVFDRLVSKGATAIVIEHDLDVIRNADYIIDMGPGGGEAGGRIIARGTPEEIASDKESVTGKYLR